jgi:two-component system CheB/CheR fusion protein
VEKIRGSKELPRTSGGLACISSGAGRHGCAISQTSNRSRRDPFIFDMKMAPRPKRKPAKGKAKARAPQAVVAVRKSSARSKDVVLPNAPRKDEAAPVRGADSFPIVAIGASAGGLESITRFLQHLPPNPGMAFVLVQHLHPDRESVMAALLSRVTDLEIAEARHHERLRPDRVYVIPPNKRIELSGQRLRLLPRRDGKDMRLPVDGFMRSLAEVAGPTAIGIVLSGTGTDGTQGLLAIKAGGGVTFAESQQSAKYPGMAASAVAAGGVDFVLTPERIARELKTLVARPRGWFLGEKEEARPLEQRSFDSILALLRQRHGVDFTHYKHATLRRRIHRRMVLSKRDALKDYAALLRSHPTEVKELFQDILIHVTGFFRDSAVFRVLQKKLLPRLLKDKSSEEPLRIWIPGCSTGEEVYSIAILIAEFMRERKVSHPVQIFGTDVNELALSVARTGLYTESAVNDVSAGRLQHFFYKTEGGYRVNKTIRELCIFARQNLVNDPPFSNLDLISCRNVLIYLGPALQRKIMPVFHYALRNEGLLMLGVSETIGSHAELFSLLDAKAKVYVKKAVQVRPAVSFAPSGHSGGTSLAPLPAEHLAMAPVESPRPNLTDVQKQADRIILANYSLPGVIINAQLEVMQFRGRTGPFLEHGHGDASLHLLKMARDGLALELRTAVLNAVKQNTRIRQEGVRVQQSNYTLECNFEIVPFSPPPARDRFYLIVFEAGTARGKPEAKLKKALPQVQTKASAELAQLREELAGTRESLQAIIEEQEATNEELRSANEEIMSSNEELQSTNEELETAKEELQSTNEELTTLNDELESRNSEMEQVNNDLQNLLASVNLPILILDAEVRIRRFTGVAEKLFKLIPSDVGRPVTDINLPVEIPSLHKLVLEVFDSLSPKDLELQDKLGHWWSVRIRPYKTAERKIEGAVLAFVDIDEMKANLQRVMRARDMAEAVVKTVREPLLVLNKQLHVTAANPAFYRTFKVNPAETLEQPLYELGNRQWDITPLRKLLAQVLLKHSSFEDFMVEHTFPQIGPKRMLLNGRYLDYEPEHLILLAIEETQPD